MSLDEKVGEKAAPRRHMREKRQPVFVARARQADSNAWLTIGVA